MSENKDKTINKLVRINNVLLSHNIDNGYPKLSYQLQGLDQLKGFESAKVSRRQLLIVKS